MYLTDYLLIDMQRVFNIFYYKNTELHYTMILFTNILVLLILRNYHLKDLVCLSLNLMYS